jgi:hypothetical protein
MASKNTPAQALTFAQAKAIVDKFRTDARVNAARVRVVLPHRAKSAVTIADEVYLAYHAQGVNVPYAFGESTVQTALNVARVWANLPTSGKSLTTAAENEILDMLVQIRRSPAKLPNRTIPKGVAVKRTKAGTKPVLAGGDVALTHVAGALATAGTERWMTIVTGAYEVLITAFNDTRRTGKGAKSAPASDDDAATDVVTAHNERAADAREGDEKAEKRNGKATRKSKHERDPLEPAKPGNGTENLPGAGAGLGNGKAPAQVNPLAETSVEAMLAEIAQRIKRGYVPTRREDDAMNRLAGQWEERVTSAPAKSAGSYVVADSAVDHGAVVTSA